MPTPHDTNGKTASDNLAPCTIIIFGASGDLAARKLFPSLYNLFLHNHLPQPINIVGCSRTEMTNDTFRQHLYDAIKKAGKADLSRWPEFAALLSYRAIAYDDEKSYSQLASFLRKQDTTAKTLGNRIFYLAIPPSLYPGVATLIGKAGLGRQSTDGNGWSRIVVEKPFGRDLKSAMELEVSLHKSFSEKQIFRIDHYLAKETVQNVLMFRFANTIFEPLWNRNYIDSVSIIAAEKLGVEHRAGYYEQAGVLRDMFQNHMMQLLALIAMEPPSLFQDQRVQDEKVKVFRSLKPLNLSSGDKNIFIGQYQSGEIDGAKVCGYRQEAGVAPDSLTPTFALMRLFIDNWRWRHVPFYLTSAKRMPEKITRIIVQFKAVPHSMFANILGHDINANRLVIDIFPEEKISLTFEAKEPGSAINLRPVIMDFTYKKDTGPEFDAYEKVLLDCIIGDHMLFWRQDGVELTWSFLTPILETCESCNKANRLEFYKAGSWGPKAVRDIMHSMVI